MNALRSHPFFSGIDWKTLWTAPAPPLESGLVKKEQKEGRASAQWDDMGAMWDELVDGGREEDEISWASDDEQGEPVAFGVIEANGTISGVPYVDEAVGPKGELRPSYSPSQSIPVGQPGPGLGSNSTSGRGTPRPLNAPNGINGTPSANGVNGANGVKQPSSKPGTGTGPASGSGVRFAEDEEVLPSPDKLAQPSQPHTPEPQADKSDSGAEADEDRDIVAPTLDNLPAAVKTQPIDVPFVPNGLRDSYSTGSATSSSEGSPPNTALDAALTLARGRDRTQTPIQGNEPAHADEEWYIFCVPSFGSRVHATFLGLSCSWSASP